MVDDIGNGIDASHESAERLLRLSHRIAYSSFAPLLGSHLIAEGPFNPPFPGTIQMQLSGLSNAAQYAISAATCYVDAYCPHCSPWCTLCSTH